MASDSTILHGETSAVPHKRVAFAALQHRDFRWFFVTTMLAMMADNIEHVISYWLLFQKFHSPVLAGFADISHWTPFLLLSVYFGGIADRYDCRKVIQLAQIMYMAVSVAWAVLFYTETIQVWHASVLLVLHGIAGVLWTPAEQLVIHDMVGAGTYSERRAAQRHQPATRDTFRTGGGRRIDVATGSVRGAFSERSHLSSHDSLVTQWSRTRDISAKGRHLSEPSVGKMP